MHLYNCLFLLFALLKLDMKCLFPRCLLNWYLIHKENHQSRQRLTDLMPPKGTDIYSYFKSLGN